jgi:hypothetical protein
MVRWYSAFPFLDERKCTLTRQENQATICCLALVLLYDDLAQV